MMLNIVSVCLFLISIVNLIDCVIRDTTDPKFQGECLAAHNKYRRRHGSEKLIEDRKLNEYCARRLRRILDAQGVDLDRQGHGHGSDQYGENLYWFHDVDSYHDCRDAVKYWYSGRKYYNYNQPEFSQYTGGFTQIVWRSSKELGCVRASGTTSRRMRETYILCCYAPPGNVRGRFRHNVLPELDEDELDRRTLSNAFYNYNNNTKV